MINKMMQVSTDTTIYGVPREIGCESINTILNENNFTDITFKYPMSFTNQSVLYILYIFLQALSKILEKPIYIRRWTLTAPDEYVIRDYNKFRKANSNSNGEYLINVFEISKSAFNRASFKAERNKISPINFKLDELINNMTPNKDLLGITIDADNTIDFFIDKTNYMTANTEYVLLGLTYRFIANKTNNKYPAVHKAFKELLEALKDYTDENNWQRLKDEISNIYVEYILTCTEYKIDKKRQLTKLLNSLKDRKLEGYKNNVESYRSDIELYRTKLETAIKNFRDANFIYTAMLEKTNNDESSKSITEVTDLLTRSPIIKGYKITDNGITFCVEQPIHVNSKEDFERILQHKPEGMKTSLLKEALINEEYTLYTYATLHMNLIKEKIGITTPIETDKPLESIPHPHLMGYNCFGQYTNIITDLLYKGKYIEAVEESIEAATGLNWADNPVIEKLYSYLTAYSNMKFIEDKDKNRISFKEYINRKEQNETISNQTEETTLTD